MGTQLPSSPKGHSPPIFGQCLLRSNISIPLGTAVGLSLGDIVLDGDPAPPPLKGHSPQFSANVRCDQTGGWTKMPLRMEVGLAQATLCSMGTQLPPPEKWHSPHTQLWAHVYCGQTAVWMKTPLGMEVDLGPSNIVLDGDPALPAKGAQQPPPLFGPCLLWLRSPISTTAELLYYIMTWQLMSYWSFENKLYRGDEHCNGTK